MSSLWTPGGEHRVPPTSDATRPAADDEVDAERDGALDDDLDGPGGPDDPELAEAAAAMQAELDAARRRVAEVPASQVVANHAMGLFELGAIHLSTQPPNLPDAALAIDALGALVEGLGDRLGEATPTLREALGQIRLAFVQVKAAAGS